MSWQVYLSGEIHSDWREQLIKGCEAKNLAIEFSSPVLDHSASDEVGEKILGAEVSNFWKDHKAAKINAIASRKAIEEADVVVVRFGEKYRQWNAAFDAGYAAAIGTPLISLHDEELVHPLKEINAVALASCRTPAQIIEIFTYLLKQA